MSANGNSNGAPFKITLRDLPLPVRLVLSLFLIGVGAGYFSALVQLHFQNATRGQPLPTPNDVVEIFSGVENWPLQKPDSGRFKSKLEELIMAPTDWPHNGEGTMAFAFFKKKMSDDERQRRVGEQLAVREWTRLADDKRKDAYEHDAMDLPPSLADHPITKDFVDSEKVKVKSIIDERCSKCHADAGLQGKRRFVDYEDFEEVLELPARQMSVESLTQTTHLHLLSFCMLWMLTGVIFAFSSYWKWLRCIVAPLVLLAQIADVSFWWLARLTGPYQILGWTLPLPNPIGPYFALGIIGTGTLVGLGLVLQIVLSLWDMYRWSGRIVLLVLAIAAASGAAVLTPHVRDYLNSETAPPASAPVTPPEPANK